MNLQTSYDILLADGIESPITLADLFAASDTTILYFYPRDNTPGCTVENKDFTCLKSQFAEKGVQLVGVSKDSIESHKKFVEKQELGVALISDPELVLHKELGAYGEKKNYGKIVQGVIRSSFVFDSKGKLIGEYRNIKAKGHAERMLGEV